MKIADKEKDGTGTAKNESTVIDKDKKRLSSTDVDDKSRLDDEDYWEEMLFISRGPNGWNIGCGCG